MPDCETANCENDPFKSVTEHFHCAQEFVDKLIEIQEQ